jgi:hypothetical protein
VEVLGLRVIFRQSVLGPRGACHIATTAWRIAEPLLHAEDATQIGGCIDKILRKNIFPKIKC